jgi:hypothetical protein
MFFIEFSTWYVQFSIMCLIKDIFLGELNIIKYDLQNTVDLYRSSTVKNLENFLNLIPFFVILEIMYSYSEEYSYFKSIFQLFFEIYFACFISLVVTYYRYKNRNENSKLICVFNILQHNVSDMYLDYLLPWVFLPFTIGLNKLTIDMTFYLCILYYCFKNSNVSVFVNAVEVCESTLKIKEFKSEVSRIFGLLSKKYSQFSTRESRSVQIKEE